MIARPAGDSSRVAGVGLFHQLEVTRFSGAVEGRFIGAVDAEVGEPDGLVPEVETDFLIIERKLIDPVKAAVHQQKIFALQLVQLHFNGFAVGGAR